MLPDATLYYPLTASSSERLAQMFHQPKPKMKPMALTVSDTDTSIKLKMQAHLYLVFCWVFFLNCSKQQIAFRSFHFECRMRRQNLWSNVLWSWCAVLILQETPASNTFREIRSELVIFPLHACVFYRTGISMQDQTLWNCFHNRQNTEVVHLLLKCCSATSRTCLHW